MTNPNNSRTAVENLQRYLRKIAEHRPEIPLLIIDGIFGKRTEEAVRAFQRLNGLPETGRVDMKTWDAIFAEYQRYRDADQKPAPVLPFPQNPDDYSIDVGANGYLVALVQYMLDELSIYYELGDFAVNGVYDDKTADAVRRFQKVSGLSPDGRVDKNTWNHLAREFNNIATRNVY